MPTRPSFSIPSAKSLQPTLTTSRLTLKPLNDSHLAFELELDANAEVTRYLFRQPRTAAEIHATHARRLQLAINAPGYGYWVGELEDEAIGWFLLQQPEQEPREGQAELGYRLLPRFWRRGLATEGARELLRYAFEDLGLEGVFAETYVVNAGSRATMVKLEMTHIRTYQPEVDENSPVEGVEEGMVEYAITREQWEKNQLAS